MLDDHKYSIKRKVVYRNSDHLRSDSEPDSVERACGTILGVHLVDDNNPHWEYTIVNSLTGENLLVREDDIFHGAEPNDLNLHRRDDISWLLNPPASAKGDTGNDFWRDTLKHFVQTAIPRIRAQEVEQEETKEQGRKLDLQEGDYIRIRGDLRVESENIHNFYAKIISVSPSDRESIDIPKGIVGIAHGKHKVTSSYRVRLDTNEEVEIYDVEVKAIYTSQSRKVVFNWRAATFLAEAFGDEMPYNIELEYLNGHVFSRAELADLSSCELSQLLAHLLYVKGFIGWGELPEKADNLISAPVEYLIDQLLEYSRFDMQKNRALTDEEIMESHLNDDRLRNLIE